MELKAPRPLAVVTGASSGIGYHLACCAAEHGYDLVVAADMPLEDAVCDFQALGAQRVEAIQTELASRAGIQQVCDAIQGRILITGSIAGFQPGSFHAVYNGSKAFIDSFALALRNELRDTGVTVSLLMPGPTDTDFFLRADLEDTKMGSDMKKDDPEYVARIGFDAMLKGEADIITGFRNRMQVAASRVMPAEAVAEIHRRIAEPGAAQHQGEHHA